MNRYPLAVLFLVSVAVGNGEASAQLLKPLPAPGQLQQRVPVAQGPAPESVQVTGTPTTAVVSWTSPMQKLAAPGAVSLATRTKVPAPTAAPAVIVERIAAGSAPLRLNVTAPSSQQVTDAGPLTPGRPVTYRVTITDSAGVSGSKEAVFTPPPPRDPAGLTAAAAADGSVTLTWQEVPGVLAYQVTGTALTAPVIVNRATQWRSPPQPPGARQWKVASVYEPGGVLTASSAWPSVNSRVLPVPTRPFLVMPNGAGSLAESAAAYQQQCGAIVTDPDPNASCPDVKFFLRSSPNWRQTYDSQYGGGFVAPAWPSVAFADLHDLGLGRRVNCTPIGNALSRMTLCWATSHGQPPAPHQSPNGSALATAGEQAADIKSINVILMSANGAFFGTWEYQAGRHIKNASSPLDRENAFADASGPRYVTALDNQGLKSVPNACLSCHGGRYDATRKIVVGASLLPLIPAQLTFSSPQARASAEEQIRRINQIILDSNPAPAIRAQINTLYNGAPGAPGTRANDQAVPPGWASQPGLYRQVIAPYCGSCHFAQTGLLHFGTLANVMEHKQRIQRAVCTDFSMPHSEVAFRRFWTDGGPVSLPGMLSTVLGYPKCPT